MNLVVFAKKKTAVQPAAHPTSDVLPYRLPYHNKLTKFRFWNTRTDRSRRVVNETPYCSKHFRWYSREPNLRSCSVSVSADIPLEGHSCIVSAQLAYFRVSPIRSRGTPKKVRIAKNLKILVIENGKLVGPLGPKCSKKVDRPKVPEASISPGSGKLATAALLGKSRQIRRRPAIRNVMEYRKRAWPA